MRQTILNEQPFQVLTTAFSIGPSTTGYDLQISADGVNFTTLFSVPADTTRMITNVARGSTYRCLGNDGQIVVNWVRDCSDGEGGGGGTGPQGPMGPAGPQGPQGPAGSGSTGDNHILKSVSEYPESADTGDVIALNAAERPVFTQDPSREVYGGSINDFHDLIAANDNRITISTWDNEQQTDRTEWGWFHLSGDSIYYYNYQGEIEVDVLSYITNDGEWVANNDFYPLHFYKDGNNLFFVINRGDWGDYIINGYGQDVDFVLPVEGSVGVFQYDGNNWNKIGDGGETGDSHLLKSSLDIPEDAELGDVFSIYTSGTPAQYGSAWTDTNETTINLYDVQAIRVRVSQDGYFDFGFDDADWHDGMHFYVENNGTKLRSTDSDTRVEAVSSTELKFIAPEWYEKHNHKTMHVKLDNGYLYVWSDDINELHLTDIAQNGLGGTIETGEVVPEVPSVMGTYQAVVGEVYMIKVDFPNGTDQGDHWDSTDMTITINEWPDEPTRVVNIEWYGSRYYFEVQDSQNQLIQIYDDNEDKVAAIVEGDSGTISMGQNYSYDFSNGVFSITGDAVCVWENVVDITKAGGIDKRRLMFADEADYQKILPNGSNDQDLIAWRSYDNTWGVMRAGGILTDQLRNYGTYNNGQEAIVRTGYWDINWQPVIISSDVLKIVKISQSDYDTLVQNDEVEATTLYLIVDNNQGS